jgi:Holliday junction resolvase RusA-like endonuclease
MQRRSGITQEPERPVRVLRSGPSPRPPQGAIVNLFVPGNPVPQGSKRAILRKGTNIPIVLDSNRIGLAHWRAQVCAYAMERKAKDGALTIHGPVAIRLEFWFKRPADHYFPVNSKRTTPELKPGVPGYVAAAPDLDKLIRAVFDALTDADVWHDDGQVVKAIATKLYSDAYDPNGQQPGVIITVQPWGK